MKILFIGKRFYTNKDALIEKFGRIFRLPDEWAKSGYDVRLWLVDYHSLQSRSDEVGVLKVSSTAILSFPFVKAIISFWKFRPAIIVASGDCYVGLLGFVMSCLSRAKFVFDIYDKYDEFAGYVRPLGFDIFGFLRRRADLVSFASSPLADTYRDENRSSLIVFNGVDRAEFKPLQRAECRKTLGLHSEGQLIGYFGGMEPDRGVQDLIDSVAGLRVSRPDVRLLLCGKAHNDLDLAKDWIIFRGMVPHSDIPLYLNACDVLAVPYRLSPFMDMGASCKIAEYLMCERPIVSTTTPNFVGNFPAQAAQLGQALCAPSVPTDLQRAILFQLDKRIIAAPPTQFAWDIIAEEAMSGILLGLNLSTGESGAGGLRES